MRRLERKSRKPQLFTTTAQTVGQKAWPRENPTPSATSFLFPRATNWSYSRRGYDLTLSVVNDEDEEQAYRDMATKGSVDGIIVHGPRTNDPRIELLKSIGMPFVVHGRGANQDVDYAWVDVNNKSAFQRATEFLLDLGHKKIALINGDEAMHFAARRRMGYEEALTSRNIKIDHDRGLWVCLHKKDAGSPRPPDRLPRIFHAFGHRSAKSAARERP